MKNKKQIIVKLGAILMSIGFLLSQLMLPISAKVIDVPQVSIAGPPIPGLTIEVENISQDTGHYATGDILKYTLIYTNDGPNSTWYDVEVIAVLGVGLDLLDSYPITVDGDESVAAYDMASKTISAEIGDIDAEFGELNIEKSISTYINENQVFVSDMPTLNNIKKDDDKITGTGVPGAEITVTLPDGSEVTTIVENDGTWSIDVPDTLTLAEGDLVTAVQKEENKEVSQPVSETVQDLQRVSDQSEAPTIDVIYDGDREINGTGVPGAEIIVTLPDGSEVTTIVEDDGTWSVDVPDGVTLNAGDKVTVVQREEGKADSQPIVGVVQVVEELDVSTEKPSTTPPTQKPSVDTSISSSTSISDVNTGDNTNVSLLLGMLVTSLAGILFVSRKRKEVK